MVTEETINLLNEIDGSKIFVYWYACLIFCLVLFVIYLAVTIPIVIYVKRAKNKYVEEQNEQTKNIIREYNSINIYNASKYYPRKEKKKVNVKRD